MAAQKTSSQSPENGGKKEVKVVISGMSGAYPNTKHIKGLSEILYNKVNPMSSTESRWQSNYPGLPEYVGMIPELDKFDAQFFKVHYRLGTNMDPMSKLILEQVYQAIYDAGCSPEHLDGRHIGVYVGSCFSETEKASFYVASNRSGFGIAGCSKAMFANRISYWLNLKGPSMSIDATCSSSLVALELAHKAIVNGEIEAAIVGGANLCLHPQSSMHYGRIIPLSTDGKTRSFDKNANGCCRSDAINVLYLQKAEFANRIYAEVCHAKTIYSQTDKKHQSYGPYRDPKEQAEVIEKFYEETNISPQLVEYVEAFGAGVAEADKAELQAIEKVYCGKRKQPILVGSVMSNIGYTEAASGISSITKVCLAYHTGEIAANLHCDNPRDDVEALKNGQMRIVTDHEKFGRTYAAVHSVSVTGLNGQVLLHGHYKPKDPSRYLTTLPYLVTLSSRQDSGVKNIINELKSNTIDPEQIALLHNIHEHSTSGHLGRGYAILGQDENKNATVLAEKAEYFDDAKRPLWLVYSGMGSQWAGMGIQLMRIPIFAAAIERCRQALEPKGIDIVHIITSPDKTIFDNILHSFVGIAAVQIGLTDILREIGLVPDMIIGHSVGELGCAYADGCMTAEEMILAAYSRGLVSLQTKFIRGSMAAVGLGYEQVAPMCPDDIEVACHNGPDSSTISGPAESMAKFVADLTAQGIFAKEVACSNIAYHSSYIQDAGPGLLKYLREVLKTPKKRSERWLSTSVPQDNWGHEEAQYSSAEYHTNNLLRPVLFEETSRLIPANAVLIEVAPHGLLQAILKRSLPDTCINIPLTRRGSSDNVVMLLEAIGKLYMTGYNPTIKALYPKVQFPVSTGTPTLSHFVEWAHHETWKLALYVSAKRTTAPAANFVISTCDDEYKYLEGHVINGENVFPFSNALVCVWDTLAMFNGHERKQVSVKFNDVHIYEQPILFKDQPLRIHCAINNVNGYFEVNIENKTIVSGHVKCLPASEMKQITETGNELPDYQLLRDDVYKILHERGYAYRKDFRSILNTNSKKDHAEILWKDNWVTAIDAMIQFNTIRRNHKGVSEGTFIRHLYIDVDEHTKALSVSSSKILNVDYSSVQNSTKAGGIVMTDVKFNDIPIGIQDDVMLKTLQFFPYYQPECVNFIDQLNIYIQLASENLGKNTMSIVNLTSKRFCPGVMTEVEKVINQLPYITASVTKLYVHNYLEKDEEEIIRNADLIIGCDLSKNERVVKNALVKNARSNTFLLNMIQTHVKCCLLRPHWLLVATSVISSGRLEFGIWKPLLPNNEPTVITANNTIELLQHKKLINLQPHQKLIVKTVYPLPQGFKETIKTWRNDPNYSFNKISVIMIDDDSKNIQDKINLNEVHLLFNIWRNGTLGCEFEKTCEEKLLSNVPMTLQSKIVGDLKTLQWIESTNKNSEVPTIKVHYVGLNLRDAKRASGKTLWSYEDDKEYGYGMDFSGVSESGDRVMGLMCGGAASTRVPVNAAVLWPVPDSWDLEDAATVPLPYAHAFYCLFIRTKIRPGMSILVQSGAGALGQAIISIALAHHCHVFTTVSEIKKKHFLRKLYPTLPANHICVSRDRSLQDMIFNANNGNWCDLVICSAKGELKEAFLHCVSDFGTLLDTSLTDVNETSEYRMNHLTNDRMYAAVQFTKLLLRNNPIELKTLQLLVNEGINAGYVKPITRVKLAAHEVERGMKLLLGGRLHGRLLLQINPEVLYSIKRLDISPTGSHLLVSDKIDTFMLALADMLISRGAKNILLVGEKPGKAGWYMTNKIKSWEQTGVKTVVYEKDFQDEDVNFDNILKLNAGLGRPVEGVYFIAEGEFRSQKEKNNDVLQKLDETVRSKCETIKYFAIISECLDTGRAICLNRNRDEMPATLIILNKIDKFENEDNTNNVPINTALHAIERAVLSAENVVIVKTERKNIDWVDRKIATVLATSYFEEIDENLKLKNFIDLYQCLSISEFLKNKLNIAAEAAEDVPELTVARLRELLNNIKMEETDKGSGLNVFFKHVDPDEMSATTEMILLPTLTNNASKRDDEFDPDLSYLCIIPGLDGHHNRFHQLCERLKIPAVALQPGLDYPHETVPQIAQRLVKNLLKMIHLKDTFFLLGYSFGALIALEMAAILEEKGLVGIVYCVDGSPDVMAKTLKKIVPSTVTDLQDSIILHMYSLMNKEDSTNLTKHLKSSNNWSEKLDLCMRELSGKIPHSSQYARALIETAYGRIEQALKYDGTKIMSRPLNSRIVVVNASDPSSSDLGLSKYTLHPPISYPIEASHASVLEHLECSNIINNNLGNDIINKFEKINLCETFLTNAETFMQSS